jgi:hypothetical protein
VTTAPLAPPEPRHGIAELLRLVSAVRRLAFDRKPAAVGGAGQDPDAFRSYDEVGIE